MDSQIKLEAAIRGFRSEVPVRGRANVGEFPNDVDLWIQYLDQEIRLGDKRVIRALFDRATSLMLTPKNMMILFEKYRMYEKSLGDKGRIKHVDGQAIKYAKSPLPFEGWENIPRPFCIALKETLLANDYNLHVQFI